MAFVLDSNRNCVKDDNKNNVVLGNYYIVQFNWTGYNLTKRNQNDIELHNSEEKLKLSQGKLGYYFEFVTGCMGETNLNSVSIQNLIAQNQQQIWELIHSKNELYKVQNSSSLRFLCGNGNTVFVDQNSQLNNIDQNWKFIFIREKFGFSNKKMTLSDIKAKAGNDNGIFSDQLSFDSDELEIFFMEHDNVEITDDTLHKEVQKDVNNKNEFYRSSENFSSQKNKFDFEEMESFSMKYEKKSEVDPRMLESILNLFSNLEIAENFKKNQKIEIKIPFPESNSKDEIVQFSATIKTIFEVSIQNSENNVITDGEYVANVLEKLKPKLKNEIPIHITKEGTCEMTISGKIFGKFAMGTDFKFLKESFVESSKSKQGIVIYPMCQIEFSLKTLIERKGNYYGKDNLKNLKFLDLSNIQIETIPKEIGELKNLESLNLYENQIFTIPKEFIELKSLRSLNICRNQMKIIPIEICEMKFLESLDISGNQIKTIPKEFSELKNLKSLDISENQIETISNEICGLENLESIRFYGNQIKTIPKEISELKNLKSLNLSGNQIEIFPNEICELKNLESLDISRNQIKTFPKEITELKNLKSLDISENQIETISKEICGLENLESILFYGNQIKTIPKEIGELKNLKSLNLSRNQIEIFPKEFSELKNMKILLIFENQLKTVPKEIIELKNLKSLNLSRNQIITIPNEICELKNLESLDLFRNQIEIIPNEIGELKNLKYLYIFENQIKTIPKEISELKNLESLNLSKNQIETIPNEICELKNLKSLDISENQIKTIPKEISELKNLKSLNLSKNQIETIPKEIQDLKNLNIRK
jgi:Leucine-rich repeat (LRR) protein